MSSGKIYGHDGPPQLHGRFEDISPDIRAEWLAAGAEWMNPIGWSDWWGKRVVCTCGRHADFEVLSADSKHPDWPFGRYVGGNYRWDLRCTGCGSQFVLFDDGIHGWNAAVADYRSGLPAGYLEATGKLLKH